MNPGIITSFIVGGILLISLLTLNIRVMEFGASSTMDIANKNRAETIIELLSNDFQKIGQDLPGNVQPFINLNDDQIRFRADTFFDDNRPFSIVTWDFNKNKEYTASGNPNDFELTRRDNADPGNYALTFPVTHFAISYLDRNGNPVSGLPANQTLVKQIKVEIILESLEPTEIRKNGEDIYSRMVWSKTFYPENLQFDN